MVFLSLIGSTVFLNKNNNNVQKKRHYKIFLGTTFAVIIAFMIFQSPFFPNYKKSVIGRFFLSEEEDYTPLVFRKKQWLNSLELFISHPLFGVGLGNYYDYLSYYEKNSFSLFTQNREETALSGYYPHNIFFETFAETGLFGLSCFVILIAYFIYKDLIDLLDSSVNNFKKQFIFSFWILFFYSLLNPANTINYLFLFWLFRALIIHA